jgi:ribosome silencing factor RsfS/YbeB/iojap
LRWPIPLHALTQINPELKELLEVTKTNIGDEERMSGLLSVLNDGSGADADGRVVAKSASPSDELVPGMEEFRDFLEKSNWRANAQRVEKAKSVREYLSSEARKTTALKMNTATTPLSKTLLGKIKVAELRQAAADLDLGQVMMGVSKKAHITAYLLAFYEYMFGSVDLAQLNNKGVRMSDASQISAHIMEDAQREMKNSSSSQKSIYNDDVKTRALEHETSPDRMNYVKAFHADELVDLLVRARGIDVMAINVRDQCTWTDHLIIATARSFHHLKALAGAVLHAVKARTEYVAGGKLQPIIEGAQNGGDRHWMAVDCGSCMVHIFSPEGRALYNLEELWADGTETKHNGPDALSLDTITVQDEDLDTHTTTA